MATKKGAAKKAAKEPKAPATPAAVETKLPLQTDSATDKGSLLNGIADVVTGTPETPVINLVGKGEDVSELPTIVKVYRPNYSPAYRVRIAKNRTRNRIARKSRQRNR